MKPNQTNADTAVILAIGFFVSVTAVFYGGGGLPGALPGYARLGIVPLREVDEFGQIIDHDAESFRGFQPPCD